MRLLFPVLILLGGIGIFAASQRKSSVNNTAKIPAKPAPAAEKGKAIIRVKEHAAAIKSYLAKHNYNKDFCFLIDMKIPSGKNRFFVYSLSGDSILTGGLATHGSGSQTETDTLSFSNVTGSLATSVGRYRIGGKYLGKFGTAYKLFGLDKTNSNAYVRAVVLHSHAFVPAQEVYPQPICLSWGCPTVSPSYLKVLEKYIDKSSKPVMLWIYY